MSVDRDAQAWVLYNSGEIFWVSTKDASCKPSGFMRGQAGFETFGMGFVSDEAGSEKETLYITGGSHNTPARATSAASTKTLVVTAHGRCRSRTTDLSSPAPARASSSPTSPAPPASSPSSTSRAPPSSAVALDPLTGAVRAWAFAHWGGRFYIFVTTLDPMTGLNNCRSSCFHRSPEWPRRCSITCPTPSLAPASAPAPRRHRLATCDLRQRGVAGESATTL